MTKKNYNIHKDEAKKDIVINFNMETYARFAIMLFIYFLFTSFTFLAIPHFFDFIQFLLLLIGTQFMFIGYLLYTLPRTGTVLYDGEKIIVTYKQFGGLQIVENEEIDVNEMKRIICVPSSNRWVITIVGDKSKIHISGVPDKILDSILDIFKKHGLEAEFYSWKEVIELQNAGEL